MTEQRQERRRERREAVRSVLKLRWEGGPSFPIEGALVDRSAHGFRVSHDHMELVSGQVVEFDDGVALRRARVMWTRILGAKVESGFLILDAGDAGE